LSSRSTLDHRGSGTGEIAKIVDPGLVKELLLLERQRCLAVFCCAGASPRVGKNNVGQE
jgi:hypothetical protein